jgi:hypothetical protein
LFQNCGYTVSEYGMERTLPNILRKIQNRDEETAKQIRSMPDFVVQNPENGQLNYVEVKYRKSGKFRLSDLIKELWCSSASFGKFSASPFSTFLCVLIFNGIKKN